LFPRCGREAHIVSTVIQRFGWVFLVPSMYKCVASTAIGGTFLLKLKWSKASISFNAQFTRYCSFRVSNFSATNNECGVF
jgi:hypothetical protein